MGELIRFPISWLWPVQTLAAEAPFCPSKQAAAEKIAPRRQVLTWPAIVSHHQPEKYPLVI
jgi:hypothetical protein